MFQTIFQDHNWYSVFPLHYLAIALVLVYLYQKKIDQSTIYETTTRQKGFFYTAMILFALIYATPLDVLGNHYLFSAHMLQTEVLHFIVVPFVLLSLPKTWLRQNLWNHRTKIFVKIIAHPWISLITFNGLLSIYYVPTVFMYLQSHWYFSIIAQLILLFNAFFMWWVIIDPIPEIKGLEFLMKALYIFLASAILMPIGFFYIIVLKPHFPVYMNEEFQIISFLTSVYDQQLAGGILKFTQMFTYALALLILFYKWAKLEQDMEGQVGDENIRYVRGVVVHMDKDKAPEPDKKVGKRKEKGSNVKTFKPKDKRPK